MSTIRNCVRGALFALTTAAIASMAAGQAVAQDKITLRYASPYPPQHIFSRADQAFFERIEEETDGRVTFQPYWAGTLISDREGMEQLASGVADIAFIAPIYSRVGKDITKSMSGWFDSRLTSDQKVEVFWKAWEKYPELRAEFEGVHLVTAHAGDSMHVLTASRPVHTIEDFEGLRLKATGEQVTALNALGAAAVAMPMGEVYTSLQKGILDGTIAPYETLVGFKFAEVIKYYSTFPSPRSAYGSRAMDQEAWDALPADIQKVFTDNSIYWSEQVHRFATEQDEEGLEFGKEQGVEFIEPSEEELAKYLEVQDRIWAEQAEKLDEKGLPGSQIRDDIVKWSQEVLAASGN